ncbi:MAG: nitroreductase family protein [Candidatus Izemoplasmatales bacterium]|nr:nitroreductase family protein [Candidatus Izemoplasmatales bacterium]
MELKEAMLKRRSVRSFSPEKIREENINQLLHYAMAGPSACNRRPWEFYVVTNEEILEKLRQSTRYSNMNAPLAIVVCGNMKKALPMQMQDFWIQDCSAAMENILLGVTSLNLGACWVGVLPQKRPVERVKKILSVDDNIIPLGIAFIGYPLETPEARDQYDINKIHIIK